MAVQPSSELTHPELAAEVSAPPTVDGLPFVDTVEHSLDSKLRLTLPASYRPAFVAGGFLVQWKGPCVGLLPPAAFKRWIGHLRAVLPDSGYEDPAANIRFAHAQGIRFRPDSQGRFQLADRLRFFADIDRDVTVVGVGSRIELWNPATYGRDLDECRKNLEFHQDQYDLLDDGDY